MHYYVINPHIIPPRQGLIIFLICKNSDMKISVYFQFLVELYTVLHENLLKDKLGNKESKCEQ